MWSCECTCALERTSALHFCFAHFLVSTRPQPHDRDNNPSAASRLSHNRLESLRQDLLLPNLLSTIEILELSNNNLLELPAIFDG